MNGSPQYSPGTKLELIDSKHPDVIPNGTVVTVAECSLSFFGNGYFVHTVEAFPSEIPDNRDIHLKWFSRRFRPLEPIAKPPLQETAFRFPGATTS